MTEGVIGRRLNNKDLNSIGGFEVEEKQEVMKLPRRGIKSQSKTKTENIRKNRGRNNVAIQTMNETLGFDES